jgi:ABC-type nitrate/sulfonate/bicarbonate transport system permease component
LPIKLAPSAARLGIIAALSVIWEVGARLFGDPLFVSPPSRVVLALVHLSKDKEVVAAVGLTCWELVVAFALSVTIGLAVGLIVGLHRFTRGSMYPIILLLYATPQVTILPLFVIIMTVAAGVQNIKPILLTSARSMGATRRQILFSVVFPHLIPSFFTGLRLGMTAVLFGVLLAELYVSQSGIGHFTTQFTQTFQPQNLFALVAVLAAIAVALNELCRRAELRFSRWHA